MSNKVLSTTNYARFKYMDGNRHINNSRVRQLIKGIKRKNMLAHFPIVCMKNCSGLFIMDGQHRFNAAKELGLPIYYVEAKNLEVADVAATNSAQKAWTPKDFIHSFAEQGNPHYRQLRDFIEEYGISPSTAVTLMSGKLQDKGDPANSGVKTGSFKVADAPFAIRVASAINAIKWSASKDRSFILAIARLMKTGAFTITRFISKLESQGTRLVKCASWEQYVELIEDIYNYRARGNDIIPLAIEVKKSLTK